MTELNQTSELDEASLEVNQNAVNSSGSVATPKNNAEVKTATSPVPISAPGAITATTYVSSVSMGRAANQAAASQQLSASVSVVDQYNPLATQQSSQLASANCNKLSNGLMIGFAVLVALVIIGGAFFFMAQSEPAEVVYEGAFFSESEDALELVDDESVIHWSASNSNSFKELPIKYFGTYIQFSSASSKLKVNEELIRLGSRFGTQVYTGLIAFDLKQIDSGDLQNAKFQLNFHLSVYDNNPELNQLIIDYIGTFKNGEISAENSSNAQSMVKAKTVVNLLKSKTIQSGEVSISADLISSDSFSNRYAVFRFTNPESDNQWDISVDSVKLKMTQMP